MKPLALALALVVAAPATAALAQAAPAPSVESGAVQRPGGADPNYTADRTGPAFYDIDARIAQMEQAASGLPRGQAAHVHKQLQAIKSDEAFRRSRHGGELRDWDRELLNKKLDELSAGLPSA